MSATQAVVDFTGLQVVNAESALADSKSTCQHFQATLGLIDVGVDNTQLVQHETNFSCVAALLFFIYLLGLQQHFLGLLALV